MPTLSYPRAALFAFAMAVSVSAGNVVALLDENLGAAYGAEEIEALSHDALDDEIASTYQGMMIALPPEARSFVRCSDAVRMAEVMKEVAAHVRVYGMRKQLK